jgi:transposase InsO family protein
MRRTAARQGVRMLKFMDVFGRWEASELSQLEAAELLGMGERTFRRWCRRYEEEGEAGLLDRLAKAPRRGAHRRKRPRRPLPGMLLHQDASRHAWLVQAPPLDLVVTMDDATNEIYSALLVEEEGTASTFRALLEVFGRHGLPLSLYTDRGSHYFHTADAGGKVDRGQPTQVGRALSHLGVEHIAAYSPQARGRSERLFQTLQDRLPKELALAGITTIDDANAWLRDAYIPAHNARFTVKAEQEVARLSWCLGWT